MKPNKPTMTTTAKQKSPSPTNARGSNPSSPRYDNVEDIESIAKQISDHAEAIYQEWKARGLAPTEILKCHPDINTSLSKTFGLEPPNEVSSVLEPEILSRNPSLSNKNLNQLVNSFVQNDKAKNDSVKYLSSKKSSEPNSPTTNYDPSPAYSSQSNTLVVSNTSSRNNDQSLKSSSQHQIPDVLKDTIERCARRQKPETPAKPEHLLNHVPTWPLKNRVMVQNNSSSGKQQQQELNTNNSTKSSKLLEDERKAKSADVLDEVSREEEKLINALKTGTALESNECLPEVIKSSIDVSKSFNNIVKRENDIEMSFRPDGGEKTRSQPTDESLKKSINFTRVNTARIPSKLEAKVDDKKFEFKTIPSPVRPFLSRGSVAERVLIFEKCPEKPTPRQSTEKPKISVSL
jgi:serine/threonine-protein phosphatase 2A regulatory subunit B''